MNLNIKFSETLLKHDTATGKIIGGFAIPGIWVSIVYFETSSPTFVDQVKDGVASQTSTTLDISNYNAGKVYIIVLSGAAGQTSNPIKKAVTEQSDISIQKAQHHGYRFDSIELTVTGSINDVANLTSVVGFGLPMKLSNRNGSVGYKVSGTDIFSYIQYIHEKSKSLVFDFAEGPLEGFKRYAVAPASAMQLLSPPFPTGTVPPFAPSDWRDYVAQFQSTSGPKLELGGFFNGAPDANGVWHNQGFYNYEMSYDGTNFWLSPKTNSQIKGHIKISPEQICNSIYATDANVEIYTSKTDKLPYAIFNPSGSPSSEMNVGANNQWGDVLKELFTGFTAGFWGGTGTPLNSYVTEDVELNQNWNWDPTWAFNSNGNPQTQFDKYSQVFFDSSNSYGSGYSDNLMALYQTGGPLLSLAGENGGNVADLDLMVYADSDTPEGYTTPNIDNYIAPPKAGYSAPPAGSGGAINMTLNFCSAAAVAGATTWVLDDSDASITLEVLTGYTKVGKVETPNWTPIKITSDIAGASSSLWWDWTVQYDAGNQTYSAAPAPSSQQSSGSMVLTGVPVLSEGVNWYRLTVANATVSKTFNLYLTTTGSQWSKASGAQAVDGGATFNLSTSGTTSTQAITINFMKGVFCYINPDQLVTGPQPKGPNYSPVPTRGIPTAPVAGSGDILSFNALPDQSLQNNNATSPSPVVAFAWSGLANLANATYTNKISPLNVALIRISGQALTTQATGVADIDGMWVSGPVNLPNGSYQVTMQEYAPGDTNFEHPVGHESEPLSLTITSSPITE